MSTFRGCESHDFCICHCSVTLPPEKEKESKMPVVLMSLSTIPFFYFFEKPREGRRKDLVLLEASGLCAGSVGVGCQRAPIVRIRYPVCTSHQVYNADLHDNTWKQEWCQNHLSFHLMFTEVLGQLVLDDFKQTDITVKLPQEQVSGVDWLCRCMGPCTGRCRRWLAW